MQLLGALLIQLIVIRVIGVGPETDVFVASQAVPVVISSIVVSALQSVWLPRLAVFSGDIHKWKNEQSIAQGQASLLGGGLFLLVGFLAPWWLQLLYPGFSEQQLHVAVVYSIILLLAAAINTQSALLTIALRAKNRFLIAEVTVLIATIFSVLAMYHALPIWGLVAAVWIILLRAILVYVVQLYLAEWPPISLFKGVALKETWLLMRPLLFGASLYKTSPLVDRYWASQSSAGGLTLMGFALTAMGAVATVIERSVCVPVSPLLARYAAGNKYQALRNKYRKTLLIIAILVFFIGALLFGLKTLFISLITHLLNLESEMAENFWLLCFLLLGYLFASVSGSLTVSIFYAMDDTKTPVKIGTLGFIASIPIKSIGYLVFSLPGLVLATSIYYGLNLLALLFLLEKTIHAKVSQKS